MVFTQKRYSGEDVVMEESISVGEEQELSFSDYVTDFDVGDPLTPNDVLDSIDHVFSSTVQRPSWFPEMAGEDYTWISRNGTELSGWQHNMILTYLNNVMLSVIVECEYKTLVGMMEQICPHLMVSQDVFNDIYLRIESRRFGQGDEALIADAGSEVRDDSRDAQDPGFDRERLLLDLASLVRDDGLMEVLGGQSVSDDENESVIDEQEEKVEEVDTQDNVYDETDLESWPVTLSPPAISRLLTTLSEEVIDEPIPESIESNQWDDEDLHPSLIASTRISILEANYARLNGTPSPVPTGAIYGSFIGGPDYGSSINHRPEDTSAEPTELHLRELVPAIEEISMDTNIEDWVESEYMDSSSSSTRTLEGHRIDNRSLPFRTVAG